MLAPFSYGSAGLRYQPGERDLRSGTEPGTALRVIATTLPMFQIADSTAHAIWKWTPKPRRLAAKRLCLFPAELAHHDHGNDDQQGDQTEPQ